MREAHGQLVALMGENVQGVQISFRVGNFGDPRVLKTEYNITVFYPEYQSTGQDSQRTCELFGGLALTEVVEEAKAFIRKEYV